MGRGIPLVSAEDARSMLPDLETLLLSNPRAKVAVTGARRIEPQEASEVADYPFVYEQSTIGEHGPSAARYVAGTVDQVVFVVACAEFGKGWQWNEVASVAGSQAQKVRRVLGSESQSEAG